MSGYTGGRMEQHPTRFAESNALLYMQEHDLEAVDEALRSMLPGELRNLQDVAGRLIDRAAEIEHEKRGL